MTTKMAPTRGIHFVFFFGFPLRSLGLFNLFLFLICIRIPWPIANEMPFATCFTQSKRTKIVSIRRNKTTLQNK